MSDIICWFLQAYYIILFAYVILSWVPRPPAPLEPVVRTVKLLVDPLVKPIRAMLPPLRMGNVGLDLSILVVFFALVVLQALLKC